MATEARDNLSQIGVRTIEDLNKALFDAAERGDVEAVKNLLTTGADPNKKNAEECPPLYLAASNGHIEVVKILLKRSADPAGGKLCEWKDDGGGWQVQILKGCETALHAAVKGGFSEVVKLWLPDQVSVVDIPGADYDTPLHSAVKSGNQEMMEILLLAGASLIATNGKNLGVQTPAACASSSGKAEILAAACTTALIETAKKRFLPVVAKDEKAAKAAEAEKKAHVKRVQALLEAGADVRVPDKDGFTALHSAATGGYPAVVAAVLAAHPSVNAQAMHGYTALHLVLMELSGMAAWEAIVEALLEAGADPAIPDEEGRTAITLAEGRALSAGFDENLKAGLVESLKKAAKKIATEKAAAAQPAASVGGALGFGEGDIRPLDWEEGRENDGSGEKKLDSPSPANTPTIRFFSNQISSGSENAQPQPEPPLGSVAETLLDARVDPAIANKDGMNALALAGARGFSADLVDSLKEPAAAQPVPQAEESKMEEKDISVEQKKEYWNPEAMRLERLAEGAAVPANYRLISPRNTPETALTYRTEAGNLYVIRIEGAEVFYYVHYKDEAAVTLCRITENNIYQVFDADGRPQVAEVVAPESEDLALQRFTQLGMGATCWYLGKPLIAEEAARYGLRLERTKPIARSAVQRAAQAFGQYQKQYRHISDAQEAEPGTFYFDSGIQPSELWKQGFVPTDPNEANKLYTTFWERYRVLPLSHKIAAALAIILSLAMIVLAAIPAHILTGTFLAWAAPLAPFLGGTGFLGLLLTLPGHWIDIALESNHPQELGLRLKGQSRFIKGFRYLAGFLFIAGIALALVGLLAPLFGAPAGLPLWHHLLIYGPSLCIPESIFMAAVLSFGDLDQRNFPSGAKLRSMLLVFIDQVKNTSRGVKFAYIATLLLIPALFAFLRIIPQQPHLLWGMSLHTVVMLGVFSAVAVSLGMIFGNVLLQRSEPVVGAGVSAGEKLRVGSGIGPVTHIGGDAPEQRVGYQVLDGAHSHSVGSDFQSNLVGRT